MTPTIGSLFDGSGGFPLAAYMCGIKPVWASEIEPYPIAVTKNRFPDMQHLGDISKINGADIQPVDVITFGSPCQDLSVAGKRAGLDGKRSGLFLEAIRIIKEMRCATNGKYPTFVLWENVPGAFSSNKGEDFRTVLEQICSVCNQTVSIPGPPKGKWCTAGEILGDSYSLAWRTYDAQYWGVPQRRKRIYLVADFAGQRAGKIQFERQGLQGHFTQGRTPWERTAGDVKSGADRNNRIWDARGNGDENIAPTITGDHDNRITDYTKIICTATQQAGAEILENVCPTITASAGMSGNNQPYIAAFIPKASSTAKGIGYDKGRAPTLKTDTPPAIVYALQGNVMDRPNANCNGCGYKENVGYTLNTIDRHGVVFRFLGFGYYKQDDISGTLKSRDCKDASDLIVRKNKKYTVRRLTPTECARLQGFPDWWADIPQKADFTDEELHFWANVRDTYARINGKQIREYTKQQMLTWYNKLHTDGAEYKMWGNGIALPTALFVMQGIRKELEE